MHNGAAECGGSKGLVTSEKLALFFDISKKNKKKVVLSLGKASLLCAVRENSGRRLISRNYSSQWTMRTPTKIRACVDAPHEFFQIIKSYARHERLNERPDRVETDVIYILLSMIRQRCGEGEAKNELYRLFNEN